MIAEVLVLMQVLVQMLCRCRGGDEVVQSEVNCRGSAEVILKVQSEVNCRGDCEGAEVVQLCRGAAEQRCRRGAGAEVGQS